MSLKSLPSGRNFRLQTGAGNFSKKLSQATKAGSLKHLQDNQESIVKALKPMEKLIRRGSFGRVERLRALKKIKELEGGNLTYVDKRDIKKVLAHIGSQPQAESLGNSKKPATDKIASDSPTSVSSRRSLVRRAEAQSPEDYQVPGRQGSAGDGSQPASGRVNRPTIARVSVSQSEDGALPARPGMLGQAGQSSVRRGEVAQASLRYERMGRLGSGESARNLQKQAFSKLQAAGGSSRPLAKRRPN